MPERAISLIGTKMAGKSTLVRHAVASSNTDGTPLVYMNAATYDAAHARWRRWYWLRYPSVLTVYASIATRAGRPLADRFLVAFCRHVAMVCDLVPRGGIGLTDEDAIKTLYSSEAYFVAPEMAAEQAAWWTRLTSEIGEGLIRCMKQVVAAFVYVHAPIEVLLARTTDPGRGPLRAYGAESLANRFRLEMSQFEKLVGVAANAGIPVYDIDTTDTDRAKQEMEQIVEEIALRNSGRGQAASKPRSGG